VSRSRGLRGAISGEIRHTNGGTTSRVIKSNGRLSGKVSDYQAILAADRGPSEITDPATILEEARAEAQEKVREAYAEGMRRGMEAGEAKFRKSVAESIRLLQEAGGRLEASRMAFLNDIEPQLVHLAVSIAEKILEREAQLSSDVVKRTARSVLERVMDEEHVVLRVNPADLEALREYRVEALEQFDGLERLDVMPDETIDPGGCIAQTDSVQVDGRLNSQLECILNELLS